MSRSSTALPGLGAFLVQELVPSAHRWRASIRLSVTATLALVLVMATHLPQGEYLIVLLFLVGQNDVWASPRRAWLRFLWLMGGCVFVVWTLAAFADKPWIRFPLQSIVLGACIFLGRTSTTPFAVSMFAICFLLCIPEYVNAPQQDLLQALERLVMVVAGVVLGTLVQLAVWREQPQELLRRDLAERLRWAGTLLGTLGAGPTTRGAERAGLVATTGLTGQLDLLDAAEQETPGLRRRHAEQLKLITEVQVVTRGAIRLQRELDAAGGTGVLAPHLAARLAAIRTAIDGVASALEQSRPDRAVPLQPPTPVPEQSPDELPARLALGEMEHALQTIPGLLGFLDTPAPSAREAAPRQPFLTAAFRLDNAVDVRVAIKAMLAITVCGLSYEALNWPGLSACVFATIVLAQGSVGASVERSLVQILCVLVGAGWALLIVTAGMPNMTSVASLLVLTFPFFFAVAWVCSGPGVSTTAGVQMAMAGSLVVLAGLGPTIDLIPARDRVLGILLGNVVFALINLSLWPVYAGSSARLTAIVRQMAGLLRPTAAADPKAGEAQALEVYRGLAREMALQDEARFEPLSRARDSYAALRVLLLAAARLQDLFLEVLELRRLHAGSALSGLPPGLRQALETLENAAADRLEAIARSLDGAPLAPEVELDRATHVLDQALTSPTIGTGPSWAPDAVRLSSTRLVTAIHTFETALQGPVFLAPVFRH